VREVRGLRPGELDQVSVVVGEAFHDDDAGWLREQLVNEVGYGEWWQTRVALEHGRMVASVQLLPRLVRYGDALLPMLGVGNVSTLPDCQGQGHASALLADAAALGADRGYPLGMLFTDIADFYRRLGWESVSIPICAYRPLPGPGPGAPAVRNVAPGDLAGEDLDRLAALHERTNAFCTGPMVRSPAYWRHVAGRRLERYRVLLAGSAYLALTPLCEPDALGLLEVGCPPGAEGDLKVLLAEASRLALASGTTVLLSPGPAVIPSRLWEGVGEPASVPPEHAHQPVMFAVFDWPQLLQYARPELTRRWQAAGCPPLDLTTSHRGRTARLRWVGERLDIGEGEGAPLELSDSQAVALYFGQWPALPELAADHRLRTLFTGQPFHFWPLDGF